MRRHTITIAALLLAAGSLVFAQAEQEQLIEPEQGQIEEPRIQGQQEFELVEESGVLITRIVADSAAERAGLMRGDIIVSIDGTPIDSIAEITEYVRDLSHGDTVSMSINRGEETLSIDLVLETRVGWPLIGIYGTGSDMDLRGDYGPRGQMSPKDRLPEGMQEFFDLFRQGPRSEDDRYFFSEELPEEVSEALEAGTVARVSNVSPEGPAETAGITEGMLILSVDDTPVLEGDLKQLILAYSPGESISLRVYDGEQLQDINVTLADNEGNPLLGVEYYPAGLMMQNRMGPGTRYPQGLPQRGLNMLDG